VAVAVPLVAFCLSLALGACGSSSRHAVYLPAACGDQTVAPMMFVPAACADGRTGVYEITWQKWGAAAASGRGLAYASDCPFVCAGDVIYSPAEIEVGMPRQCPNGLLQYTHVTVSVGDPKIALVLAGSYTVPCTSKRRPGRGASRSDPGP
jgi:hypothetical protein